MVVSPGAGELHKLGVAHYNAGRPARALATLQRALSVVDEIDDRAERRSLAARIWVSITISEAELYGVERGLQSLDDAAEMVTAAADPSISVAFLCQRGSVLLRAGRLHEAFDAFDAAYALIEHAEPHEKFILSLNRGSLHIYLGNVPAARADLTAAVALARESGSRDGEFQAMHNLAYVTFVGGDLPGALRQMDEALEHGGDVRRDIPLLDRARVLVEAGLTREADETLAEAAAIFRSARLTQDLAEVELERARCALIIGDVAGARRLAARARDKFRRREIDSWRRAAELVLLQGDLAAGRPGRRLAPVGIRLRAEFASAGMPLRSRSAALIAAQALLAVGQTVDAEEILTDLPRGGPQDPITLQMHDTLVRARLLMQRNQNGAASAAVRSGLRRLSNYQASFGSIDLQTASAVHGRELADMGVSLALAGRRAGSVLAAVEHARAVSSRLPVVRPPDDPESAALLAELRLTIESTRDLSQGSRETAELTRRRRSLEDRIKSRRWALAGTGDVRPIAGVGEVEAELGADCTMLVLIENAGALFALVIDAGRAGLHELGAAAPVVEHVRRMRADLDLLSRPGLPVAIRSTVRRSFEHSCANVDATLVRPLRLGLSRVVVVTTGILGQLPWPALPSLYGVPVVVAPSASGWLAAAAGADDPADGDVALLAGPELARAGDEVRGIGTGWLGANVLTGAAADRRALTEAMAKCRIVHVAAHGVHQTENPLFSSLHLADGPLFAHELDQTARTPEHVVLSACELGLATVRPGDEALGLTSVLLHLGTRSVVAGVARVNDDVAADTMINYHTRLARGEDSAAALAGALAAGDPDQVAPFVCFGAAWSDTPLTARPAHRAQLIFQKWALRAGRAGG
jgi:tetratricopeptide (TPR) repeat protein